MSSPRILTLVVAAVAGLFLAYEFIAWWQDREFSAEEQALLHALNVEFDSVQTVLTQQLTEQQRTRELLEALLNSIENGSSRNAGPIVDSALLEMTSYAAWDRDESTLDALLSSDRTKNLSSEALRTKLDAWNGVISEDWGDQEIANRMVDDTHVPYFASKNIPVGAAMSGSEGIRPAPGMSAADNPDVIRQLLQDPKFHVLAEVRYRFKEYLIVEIEKAIAAAKAITAEIEQSLD